MNSAASSKRSLVYREKKGSRALCIWAKNMEDGKNLDSTIEESLGVWETVCIESVFRNWRDPTLHSDSCKEESYKLMK
ncbi:MAG TPA: hypothetical protein VHP38_15995 [Ruminiclostridium sp.]|nr:hypothetical protein [Ruminiclostridium sp.]